MLADFVGWLASFLATDETVKDGDGGDGKIGTEMDG